MIFRHARHGRRFSPARPSRRARFDIGQSFGSDSARRQAPMKRYGKSLVLTSAVIMVFTALGSVCPAAKAQDFASMVPDAGAPPAPGAIPRLIKFNGALSPPVAEMASSEAAGTAPR